MAFDGAAGGYPHKWCKACQNLIVDGQQYVVLDFIEDDLKHLTGPYHLECSRPYASILHVLNLLRFPFR